MPVIFVIIDEFAQMSQILKDTKGSGVGSDYAMKLENILREGRAVGFKFIFSSQTYSDGVEGLTESARKQIQQRLAMKNTYQEIKDTLALSSDSISPAIQNAMNTLPYLILSEPPFHRRQFANHYKELLYRDEDAL